MEQGGVYLLKFPSPYVFFIRFKTADRETIGKQGYYFASTQEHSHNTVANAISTILKSHNLIKQDATPLQLSLDQIDALLKFPGFPTIGRYLFASNSRSRADRAQGLWGYEGSAPGLLDVLEEEVLDAVKRL